MQIEGHIVSEEFLAQLFNPVEPHLKKLVMQKKYFSYQFIFFFVNCFYLFFGLVGQCCRYQA